jgi:hypothetical protein
MNKVIQFDAIIIVKFDRFDLGVHSSLAATNANRDGRLGGGGKTWPFGRAETLSPRKL